MSTTQHSVGVFTTDTDLAVQVWDDALARLTSISAASVTGKQLTEVIPNVLKRGLLARFQRALEQGTVEVLAPAFHHFLIPCPPRSPSNRFKEMQQRVTIGALRTDDSIAGLIVTIEDVTERLDRERDLAEQLKQGNEASRLDAAQKLADDQTLEPTALVDGLYDESWKVRRAAVTGVAKRAAPEAISAILRAFGEDHQDPALLNSALQILASSDVDTLSPLLDFLENPNADLRMQAALALGEQRDLRAVPALIKALDDGDVNVRYHVIEALGKMQATDAVDDLLRIVETRDFFLAFPALDALSNLGEPRVAAAIVPFLEDEQLREPAATLLGRLGNDEVVGPLVKLLNSVNTPTELIALALTRLYERYESQFREGDYIADLTRNQITPTGFQNLLDALVKPDLDHLRPLAIVLGWLRGVAVDRALTRLLGRAEVREEVVEALVRHGSGTVGLLIDQLSVEDIEVRRAAIIALGRIGDPAAATALTKLLSDESLKIEVANALGQIGSGEAMDGLLSLLDNDQSSVRQAAIAALNSLASSSLRERVVPLLNSTNANVRESAVKIAGYFGYPEAVGPLLELCGDEDERVKCAAIEHLVFLDEERAEAIVIDSMNAESAAVRAAAARALANLSSPQTVPTLIKALSDRDMWVRYFSARSLGRHAAPESSLALRTLVEQESFPPARIAAIGALAVIGDPQAIETAANLAAHDDSELAVAGVAALGQMVHPAALPPLVKALRSKNAAIQIEAAKFLGRRREASAWEELQILAATAEDEQSIEAAATALRSIGSDEAIGALLGLLTDVKRRELVSDVLVGAGNDQIEIIARGLNHSSPRIRRAVVEILGRMKRPRATELLQQSLTDTDALVRGAGERLIGAPGN